MKNSEVLNNIGEEIGKKAGVKHLPSEFKKKDGYKKSILLSKQYSLYLQDYCGCIFSKAAREKQRNDEFAGNGRHASESLNGKA